VTEQTPMLVADLLRIRAELRPDQPALNVDGRQTISYLALDRLSNAVARSLRALGACRDRRIALLYGGLDWIDYAVAYLGVLKSGATAVHLSDWLGPAEQERRLAECGVSGMVHGTHLAPPRGFCGWSSTTPALQQSDPAPLDVQVRPDDLADILYTSGTTGPAKAFTSSHVSLSHGRVPDRLDDLDFAGQLVAPMPLASTSSQSTVALFGIISGGEPIVCRLDDVERVAELTASYRVSRIVLTPWVGAQLVAARAHERHDLSCVRQIGFASSPLPPAIAKALLEMMPDAMLHTIYSQSEAVPAAIANTFDPEQPLAVGKPANGTDLRVLTEEGKPAAAGEIGEIWLRSDGPRRWYLDPERARRQFVDGWINTGDLGWLDEDETLHLFDRRADVIEVGGRRVSSIAVEAALYEHPAVQQAAAVGRPDADLGEVVVAFVVLDRPSDVDGIRAWLTDHLAAHELPAHIEAVDSLPRGISGKVLKRRLRDRARDLGDRVRDQVTAVGSS
jgi:fatty-acyl-CoA synthase